MNKNESQNSASSSATRQPVVVVGAGLAGLACAHHLNRAGVPVIVLEAADAVGGRIRTDHVDGFLLDRGFQVYLTAYPEAAAMLDYDALALKTFYPGALIQLDQRQYRFADPWRRPLASLASLTAPVARLSDALRIAQVRRAALKRADGDHDDPQITTHTYLRNFGLSVRAIDRFFRPFFGGVFLERELNTPSSFFRFVFSMFASGSAALPAEGMQKIPEQLAAQLPAGTVRLNTPAASVAGDKVTTASGEVISCRAAVVATDFSTTARLLNAPQPYSWNSTTTVYYAARRSPIREAILVLNGMGRGLVNHVCVPSDAAKPYAPADRALVSVSIIGVPEMNDENIDRNVRDELAAWFGNDVTAWKLLRVYRIEHALPVQKTERSASENQTTEDGIFLCGDYLEDPSINGALVSGRKVAKAVVRKVTPESQSDSSKQ